mgnify:FL=1
MTFGTLFWLVAVLGFVTALALLSGGDPGYVLISRTPYEIEVSLSLLLFGLLVTTTLIYFLIRLLIRFFRGPEDWRRWRRRRKQERATRSTLSGFARLIEGDWPMAERLLSHHLNDSSTPLLDCLGAAYAAEQRGDENARNRYLAWAREHDPDHLVAVEVTRARFLERAGQIAQARQVLEALHDQGHRSRALQGLLVKLLHQEGDWDALEKVLNDSRRSKLLSAEQTKALTRELGVARLMTEAQGPGDGVSAAWRRLSRKERNDAGYVATYARVLISERRMNQAEQLLRRAIYRQWNTELVSLYGLAHSDRLEEQIRMAETWATTQERSPELLMTLARLYLEKGEKEKAIALLMETSRQDESQRYAMELGLLLESMGRSADALQCYRRGIEGLMADAVSTLDNPDLLLVEASANANFGSQFLALGRHTNVSAPNSKES